MLSYRRSPIHIMVSVNAFIAASGIGAALIALWIEVRFPKLGPDRIAWGLFHLLCASIVAQMLVPVAIDAVWNKLLGVFLVAIPSLIYLFLTAIWIMKIARDALGGARGSGAGRR
jgi:hypothetical protein